MVKLTGHVKNTVLPGPLRDKYRSADGPALKVALCLLLNGAMEQDDIAKELSMPPEAVERSLAFWRGVGLVCETGEGDVTVVPVQQRAPLSVDDVADITLRNPEIAVLLQETQHFLGRPIDSLESRMLVEIYEYDGLPVDVILSVVAYCAPRAKSKRGVIGLAARTAGQWREQGVTDLDSAERYIRLLEMREQREQEVAAVLGVDASSFTRTQKNYIARWYEEYGYGSDFVKEAYLHSGKDSVNYLNTILKSWYNKGYRTIRDTRTEHTNAPVPVPKNRKKGGSLLKRAIDANREG